jgi:hypothetical protein
MAMYFENFLDKYFLSNGKLVNEFYIADFLISVKYDSKNDRFEFSTKLFTSDKKELSPAVKELVLSNSKYSVSKKSSYLQIDRRGILLYQFVKITSPQSVSLFLSNFIHGSKNWKNIIKEVKEKEFSAV